MSVPLLVAGITTFSVVAAVLSLRDSSPDARQRAWGLVGLAALGILCLSIGLWGPHASEHHDDRPGHMRTGKHLKP